MLEIKLRAIGTIRTPFRIPADCPIQPRFSRARGTVELLPKYAAGLQGITRFSHIYLVYRFDRDDRESLVARPYLERRKRGIFTIRSPHRPNRIGISVVRLLSRKGSSLAVAGVDMLDRTPLLDIKPYVPRFDSFSRAASGWLGLRLKGRKNAET